MKKLLLVLLAVFLTVQSADAALTTQTNPFSLSPEAGVDTTGLGTPPPDVGYIYEEESVDLTYDLFDPSLGTLESVEISIDGFVEWHADFFNQASYQTSINAIASAGFNYQASNPPLYQFFAFGGSDSQVLMDQYGFGDTTGLRSFLVQGSVLGPGTLDIVPFVGVGTFDIEVSAIVDLSGFSLNLNDPFDQSQQGLIEAIFNGELSVTYEFTPAPDPIPAPGAILLGGIGAGLVGWLRRRRTL